MLMDKQHSKRRNTHFWVIFEVQILSLPHHNDGTTPGSDPEMITHLCAFHPRQKDSVLM